MSTIQIHKCAAAGFGAPSVPKISLSNFKASKGDEFAKLYSSATNLIVSGITSYNKYSENGAKSSGFLFVAKVKDFKL
jgi:hypothetical protein